VADGTQLRHSFISINWKCWLHVAGVANAVANKAPREFNDTTEWAFHHEVFGQISQTFFLPEVDLFAIYIMEA
jgi:hypothetical protein